jgi:glutamate receptor, ionotropic, invertebrate
MVEHILTNYKKDYTITLRQLDITGDGNYRPQLRRVKESGDTNLVLCSSIDVLPEILKQAQQVGLLTNNHQVIITSLDMHTIDLEPYQHGGTNITGFRMVSPEDSFVVSATKFIQKQFDEDKGYNQYQNPDDENEEAQNKITGENIPLKTALTFDSVLLFHHVMLQNSEMVIKGVDCEDRQSVFVNGTSIFNSMKTIAPFKGLSGEIQFDQLGNRDNIKLEVLELSPEGLKQIATWDSVNRIQTTKAPDPPPVDHYPNSIKNKTLIVLIAKVS